MNRTHYRTKRPLWEDHTTTPTNQSVLATEADCIEADLANLRYKQSGGPAKDNQARAEKLEQQWSEAARLGGRLS